ncbi:hypothetical protein E2C01_094755 [Portunus trituberculatus]|uniref:Uncharacterized protein n=1 Tax=Portunus trituberculatus TaxID=210409 RepID=A0A5B7JYH2_PORTR|nr:hypothetical protein [Portunus trituberculatus]
MSLPLDTHKLYLNCSTLVLASVRFSTPRPPLTSPSYPLTPTHSHFSAQQPVK